MLSISVWCFSSDMIDGYKNFLNDTRDVMSFSIHNLEDIDKYTQIDACGDYLKANVGGITYYPQLSYGDNVIERTYGIAYLFRDELPHDYQNCKFKGRPWISSDNILPNSNPPIFLAESIADELSVTVGAEITFEYSLNTGRSACVMTVEGIYSEEDNIYDDFIIPLSFILDKKDKLIDGVSFYLELQTPSDIMDVYPKLAHMGYHCSSMYVSLDEVNLVNSMRYILIGISVLVLILTIVVLNNTLTLTVNSRKKYMAKLKLLGATTDKVAAVYYIVLIGSFLIAFIFGIILSNFLIGYFSGIANEVLDYPITITLQWLPCLALFGLSGLLILLRYFRFRRKVKNITPNAFIKED